MKITTAKTYISAMAVAAIVLSGGVLYTISVTDHQKVASAYTSTENAQDPATAPEGYEVNIPDAKLRAALNEIIAKEMNNKRKLQGLPQDVVRTPNQKITAGEMKLPVDVFGDKTLNGKGITNAEGIQFLVNATHIDINKNQITNVAPFRDLSKLTILNIDSNRLTNDSLQVFAAMPALKSINIANNQDLTDLSPITNRKDWTTLYIGSLKFDDLTALNGMNNLKHLAINSLKTSKKLDLAPLASLQELTSLNINYQSVALTEDDMRAVKDLPKLTKVNTAGNSISNLQSLFTDGFTALDKGSTFTDQKITIVLSKWRREFDNPIKTIDGSVVPIVETANVKNKGNKIELVGLNNKGSVDVSWDTTFNHGKLTNTKFGGKLTVKYDLSDSNLPVFNPLQPAKIVSRKGVAITINDVTASDAESGLSAAGVTNNTAVINLNPANPTAGKYTLRYSATDNANNTATVDREIEITDADALQSKVAATTDDSLTGYTTESKKAVADKKAAAEAIIANNASTQAQIDQALTDLNNAISALRPDKTQLQNAIANHNSQPDHIKNDPAVVAAFANASATNSADNPPVADVAAHAEALNTAITNAIAAENTRQTEAADAISDAAAAKTPASFAAAQAKIDAVTDPARKAQLQGQLDALKNEYQAKLDQLTQLINTAKLPATTNGMTLTTISDLGAEIVDAENVRDNAAASQADIETAITDLQNAIDALRADKTPLVNAIGEYNDATLPDFIKNDPAVQAAFTQASATNSSANPSVADVRNHAQALRDALNAAVQREQDAQDTAQDGLQNTEDALNDPSLPVDQMPNIDFDALEDLINAVQDPTEKANLLAWLNDLRDAYNDRQDRINQNNNNNGNNSNPGENNQSNNQTANGGGLADTGVSLIAAAGAGISAVAGGAWLALKNRKKRK